MADRDFIFNHIYNYWRIDVYEFDSKDDIVYSKTSGSIELLEIIQSQILTKLKEIYQVEKMPVYYLEEKQIYFWGFGDNQNNMFVFGPLSSGYLSEAQRNAFFYHYKIKEKTIWFPYMTTVEAMRLMCLMGYILTGQQWNIEETIIYSKITEKVKNSEILKYRFDINSNDIERVPYEEEQQWLQKIERGEVIRNEDSDFRNLSSSWNMENIGIMAENDDFKQTEYMAVSAISLATRAAIKGGAPITRSYEISDLALQKIAKSESPMEIIQYMNNAFFDFSEAVRMRKQQVNYVNDVEQCKDYIVHHLFQKINFVNMASSLGLNNSYLSRKFSQKTGMTISRYILKERLSAASNMLRYSEESIGNIAEYLYFSSTSRFGEYFRKEYGLSPSQYREEYKIIEFKSTMR